MFWGVLKQTRHIILNPFRSVKSKKFINVMLLTAAAFAGIFTINYLSSLAMGASFYDIYFAYYQSGFINKLIAGGLASSIIGAAAELASLYLSDNPSQHWKLFRRFISYLVVRFGIGVFIATLFASLDYLVPGMPVVRTILSFTIGMTVGSVANIFFQRYFALDWARHQPEDEAKRTREEYALKKQFGKTLYAVEVRTPVNIIMHDFLQNFFSPPARIVVNFVWSYFITMFKNYISNVRSKPTWDPKNIVYISIGASVLSFIWGTPLLGAMAVISTIPIFFHLKRSIAKEDKENREGPGSPDSSERAAVTPGPTEKTADPRTSSASVPQDMDGVVRKALEWIDENFPDELFGHGDDIQKGMIVTNDFYVESGSDTSVKKAALIYRDPPERYDCFTGVCELSEWLTTQEVEHDIVKLETDNWATHYGVELKGGPILNVTPEMRIIPPDIIIRRMPLDQDKMRRAYEDNRKGIEKPPLAPFAPYQWIRIEDETGMVISVGIDIKNAAYIKFSCQAALLEGGRHIESYRSDIVAAKGELLDLKEETRKIGPDGFVSKLKEASHRGRVTYNGYPKDGSAGVSELVKEGLMLHQDILYHLIVNLALMDEHIYNNYVTPIPVVLRIGRWLRDEDWRDSDTVERAWIMTDRIADLVTPDSSWLEGLNAQIQAGIFDFVHHVVQNIDMLLDTARDAFPSAKDDTTGKPPTARSATADNTGSKDDLIGEITEIFIRRGGLHEDKGHIAFQANLRFRMKNIPLYAKEAGEDSIRLFATTKAGWDRSGILLCTLVLPSTKEAVTKVLKETAELAMKIQRDGPAAAIPPTARSATVDGEWVDIDIGGGKTIKINNAGKIFTKANYYIDLFARNIPGIVSELRKRGNKLERACELFSGRGIVAIGLAKQVPEIKEVIAVDIHEEPVERIAENAQTNGVGDKVKALQSDAFEFLKKDTEGFDLIVCDSPFIPRDMSRFSDSQLDELSKKFPDLISIFKGNTPDGRYYIDRLILEFAKEKLNPGGAIIFTQGDFTNAEKSTYLLRQQGLEPLRIDGSQKPYVVASEEKLLSSTYLTSSLKDYIEGLETGIEGVDPYHFAANNDEELVFHALVMGAVKPTARSATADRAPDKKRVQREPLRMTRRRFNKLLSAATSGLSINPADIISGVTEEKNIVSIPDDTLIDILLRYVSRMGNRGLFAEYMTARDLHAFLESERPVVPHDIEDMVHFIGDAYQREAEADPEFTVILNVEELERLEAFLTDITRGDLEENGRRDRLMELSRYPMIQEKIRSRYGDSPSPDEIAQGTRTFLWNLRQPTSNARKTAERSPVLTKLFTKRFPHFHFDTMLKRLMDEGPQFLVKENWLKAHAAYFELRYALPLWRTASRNISGEHIQKYVKDAEGLLGRLSRSLKGDVKLSAGNISDIEKQIAYLREKVMQLMWSFPAPAKIGRGSKPGEPKKNDTGRTKKTHELKLSPIKAQEMLAQSAREILSIRKEFADLMRGNEYLLRVSRGWKDNYPEQYKMVIEWWEVLGEAFGGIATFETTVQLNGSIDLVDITCTQPDGTNQSSAVRLTGTRDVGPRLLRVLSTVLVASSVPDITGNNGIGSHEDMLKFINEQIFVLTGIEDYIDVDNYNPDTIANRVRIIELNLQPIERVDFDTQMELDMAIEALRSV